MGKSIELVSRSLQRLLLTRFGHRFYRDLALFQQRKRSNRHLELERQLMFEVGRHFSCRGPEIASEFIALTGHHAKRTG